MSALYSAWSRSDAACSRARSSTFARFIAAMWLRWCAKLTRIASTPACLFSSSCSCAVLLKPARYFETAFQFATPCRSAIVPGCRSTVRMSCERTICSSFLCARSARNESVAFGSAAATAARTFASRRCRSAGPSFAPYPAFSKNSCTSPATSCRFTRSLEANFLTSRWTSPSCIAFRRASVASLRGGGAPKGRWREDSCTPPGRLTMVGASERGICCAERQRKRKNQLQE